MNFDVALGRLGRLQQLVDAHHVDPDASVLPLRRAVLQLIDAVVVHSGPLQLFVALRDPGRVPTLPEHHLRVSVEALCFGHWLGLPPGELAHLGVAGALRVGVQSADAVLRSMGGREDLGTAHGPVVMLLRDAVLARQGGEASDGGRVLALAQTWVALVDGTGRTPPRSPRTAREVLGGGRVSWLPPALAASFGRFKGPLPLGTPVCLEPGGLGIVVSRPPASPGERPVIMRSDGERIDLQEQPEIMLGACPEPGEPVMVDALKALFALL